MIYVPDLYAIADRALLPFSYIAKIDSTIGADGQPKKPWRISMSTLVAASKAGRLRTIPGNARATYGEYLKDYLKNPKSIKTGVKYENRGNDRSAVRGVSR